MKKIFQVYLQIIYDFIKFYFYFSFLQVQNSSLHETLIHFLLS